ncbi:hypothetical protein, partial [Klebsiella pneumoniae]|uniref:hypothetical protein n=1 Tax=Klebsiella pneumoniae TaxID=573 RepID=UPI001D0D5DA2
TRSPAGIYASARCLVSGKRAVVSYTDGGDAPRFTAYLQGPVKKPAPEKFIAALTGIINSATRSA